MGKKINASPDARIGDNCASMLSFDSPSRSLASGQSLHPRQGGTVRSRSLRALLFILLACSSVSLAQQGNATKTDAKAPGKTAPAKPASNQPARNHRYLLRFVFHNAINAAPAKSQINACDPASDWSVWRQ